MEIIKLKDYEEISEEAFRIIVQKLLEKPDLVLGLATGRSPLGLYNKLIKAHNQKKLDFSRVKVFNLDEYYPIKKTDKKSYYYYLFNNLLSKVNIKNENIRLLDGEVKDFKKECEDYEKKIKDSPIDIQILGVGVNGHIGFNEPGSGITTKTRLVLLFDESIEGKKSVPKKALTMGISTIMKAKKIIVLASGKNKAWAIKSLNEEGMYKDCPITILREHKDVTVIVDKEAGSLL